MHLLRPSRFTCLLLHLTAVARVDAAVNQNVKQVAIIGAGAAGSSTAYHLHKYAKEEGVDVNITIFEKTSHIGGRTLTVDVYDDPHQPVELGASIFVEANHILYDACKEFDLPLKNPGADEDGLLGIWDGRNFVYTQDSASWGWWNIAKLLWKYGSAPYYTHRLVQDTVATFLKLYEAPYFPFRSLSTRAYELGLVKITGSTGEQFLEENKLNGPFAHDIVQASTRVNYASNLAHIHGLGTMVAMAPEGAVAVDGGNWRIFSRMVAESHAYVSLNSTVSSISKEPSATDPETTKYRIKVQTSGSTNTEAETHPVAFDDVVIATPYQFSGITHDENVMPHPVDTIPYVTLHVTLFASPFRFSPAFFNLEPASEVPISVLTTLGKDDEAKAGPSGAGSAGFFSATLVKVVTNPKTQNTEYVYKIFSPDKVTPDFLSLLLGVQVPETFTRSTTSPDSRDGDEGWTVVDPISWYHPTVFHPYPQKLPRVTFQDPILGDGLYYTSGIESFISTMETSALMGKNVARLIADDYLEAPVVQKVDEMEEL
ncbi:prenylcysteine oxidase [Annulohypoxylon maeteangense]|uniref:prenylcysteine oxidase n=1 Tax=Annulohypoxylon maeteangense TaxID=1927788 RepID=UPI0020082F31|nr:prenylcysteine oxidase [Annulohypoxylon maeteangense]KAI0886552.1 prenylcysteine oxidase [Annulohypoxylon maeteangense]